MRGVQHVDRMTICRHSDDMPAVLLGRWIPNFFISGLYASQFETQPASDEAYPLVQA